jgi:GNAT superfamily N-acetyltransferase
MEKSTPVLIRRARPEDCEAICELILELAIFEKLEKECRADPDLLRSHLFSEHPFAQSLVAEALRPTETEETRITDPKEPGLDPESKFSEPDSEVVGYALYFTNYSTFLTRPGIYLEDLYVKAERRGQGIGRKLLLSLGDVAREIGAGRIEWSVLDWNESAIRFYKSLGAIIQPDWRICRVSGRVLAEFGVGSP